MALPQRTGWWSAGISRCAQAAHWEDLTDGVSKAPSRRSTSRRREPSGAECGQP